MGVSVSKPGLSAFEMGQELFDLRVSKNFLGKDKSPEAFHCKVFARLEKGRSSTNFDLVLHDDLSSLEQVDVTAGDSRLEQAAHLFGLTREWEAGKDVKCLCLTSDVLERAGCAISLNQSHLNRVAKFDKGNLIGTRSLKLKVGFLVCLISNQGSFSGGASVDAQIVDVDLSVDSVIEISHRLHCIDRCDVIANCEGGDQISQGLGLLTPTAHHDVISFVVVASDSFVMGT